eukprot:9145612-Pyramimonas_sp.AAC.1
MAGELASDAYLETRDVQRRARESLSLPPRPRQAAKRDVSALEVHGREVFAALHIDAARELAARG